MQVSGNIVTHNGKQYRTLTGQNPGGGGGNRCENSPKPIPAGWKVADDTADSRAVIAGYNWNTDVIVLSNGKSYGTKNYSQGRLWNSNMLRKSGNNVYAGNCSLAVLLTKGGAAAAGDEAHVSGNIVKYKGGEYRTLTGFNPNSRSVSCENSARIIPAGWSVAPDDADSRHVIEKYPWNTHVLVVSNGKSYGGANYRKGLWNSNMLKKSGANVSTGNCSLAVLLKRGGGPSISNCVNQSGQKCYACQKGYLVSNNKCVVKPISNCQKQVGIKCSSCGAGFQLSNDKTKCLGPIQWCQVQNGSICSQCAHGYKLQNNTCVRNILAPQGLPGLSGDRGGRGAAGGRGPKGFPGVKGRDAQEGDVGWRGPMGVPGAFGPGGPRGNRGMTGEVGHKGPIGEKGQTTIVNPWADKGIITSLRNIYQKITEKNKQLSKKKNPPINLNIRMGDLGSGSISSYHHSSETMGEGIKMNIKDPEMNPARDEKENLTLLEGFHF